MNSHKEGMPVISGQPNVDIEIKMVIIFRRNIPCRGSVVAEQVVFEHFIVEALAADTQKVRGFLTFEIRTLECGSDHLLLDFFCQGLNAVQHGDGKVIGNGSNVRQSRFSLKMRRDEIGRKNLPGGENNGPLYDIFQFTDITRPVIFLENVHDIFGNLANPLAEFLVVMV